EDIDGNQLDGDQDGKPGTNPNSSGYNGYKLQFYVSDDNARLGAEFRINPEDTTQYEQSFVQRAGTGRGNEESTRSVAVDHDGDFAVVWTSYGQDDTSDPQSAGIYLRLYDRNDNPLTDEILVNTTTAGHQRNAAIAMDADGDFVVVWESQDQDPDGSWGIYGQRFDSVGNKVDDEFRVNVEQFTGQQVNPTVAMDDFGNFVVGWATAGQDFSFFNDVYIQRYNYHGERFGLNYLVNGASGAGVGNFEVNPAISMVGQAGDFMVAWDQATAQTNGVLTNSVINARLFSFDGTPVTDVFQADDGSGGLGGGPAENTRIARNPQLTADGQGNYVMVWETFGEDDPDGQNDYGVRYRHISADGGLGSSAYVNMSPFVDQQVNPSVAVDVDGDFAVVWNGNGAEPDPLDPNDLTLASDIDREGIFLRSYDASSAAVSVQSRVNRTEAGIQQFPTIGMEPDGDMIVVWSGRGVGDQHGIFARRYDEATDTAGPLATELRSVEDDKLIDMTLPIQPVDQIKVIFDEEMWTHAGWLQDGTGVDWADGLDPDSVENPANWILSDGDGVEIRNMIQSVKYTLNPATNKWEAVLTFAEELTDDIYTITAVAPLPDIPETDEVEGNSGLRDKVGNPLSSSGFLPDGSDISFEFEVSISPDEIRVNPDLGMDNDQVFLDETLPFDVFPNSPQAIADDADGDYVVVWTDTVPEGNPNAGQTLGIYAQLYDVVWNEDADGYREPTYTEGALLSIIDPADTRFDATTATYASVSRDGDGDFVVTWSTQSLDGDGSWDVWYRRYDALGTELGAAQEVSTLSFIDFEEGVTGTFDINWDGNTASFTYSGEIDAALISDIESAFAGWGAAVTAEEVVTSSSTKELTITFANDGEQADITVSDLTLAGGGAVTTQILAETTTQGSLDGVFRVNSVTEMDQQFSTVARDIYGNFIVTWQSEGQDGNGTEIYAKRFDREGNVLEAVNETQILSFLGDPLGTFKIHWDGNESLPIAYNGNGTSADALQLVEDVKAAMEGFGANVQVQWLNSTDLQITFLGEAGQTDLPEIQIDGAGLSGGTRAEIVVGTSDDGDSGELLVNQTTENNQSFSMVAMDDLGDFVVTWTSFGQDGDEDDMSNVYARLYTVDAIGSGVTGGDEFLVNVTTDYNQKWSSVAMDADGDFVITWTSYLEDIGDTDPEVGEDGIQDVMARRFDSAGNPVDIIITAGDPGDPNANPVIPPTPAVVSSEFMVNSFTSGTQQHSQIAMDADGDFIITWESFQDRPGKQSGRPNIPENFGVYAQAYANNATVLLAPALRPPEVGPQGQIGEEEQINATTDGDQRFPGVAMDDTGDYVIVWSGYGEIYDPILDDMVVDDDQGIYSRRFPVEEDIAGPTVTDVLNVVPGDLEAVPDGSELDDYVSQFVVIFGEDLDTKYLENGAHSVLNTDNWLLRRNGEIVTDGVVNIDFGLNPATDKYEATVTFDGDPTMPGDQPLEDGRYTLTVSEEVEDIWGNALDGDYDGMPGDDFVHTFWIRSGGGDDPIGGDDNLENGRTYAETQDAVAVDGDGDHIVTWTAHDVTTDLDRVFLQVFNADDTQRTGLIAVTPYSNVDFAGDDQRYASVACDADGDFVVTWTNYRDTNGDGINDEQDIYGQRFTANGDRDGEAFRVNTYTDNNQTYSSVAMDLDGDFTVAWSSYGQEDNGQLGYGYGVYARQYDSFGQPLAPEFQ
ncbi:MAG: hypothetical protein U9N87_01630, partial [Planctomycetota bacterium]|nr:hypothetical protein [Planctomycetota bacterium]